MRHIHHKITSYFTADFPVLWTKHRQHPISKLWTVSRERNQKCVRMTGPLSVECLRHISSNLCFPLRGSDHVGGLCNVVALAALTHRFAVRPQPLLLLKAIMLRRQMFLEESMSSFPDWVCFSSVEAGPCYSDEKKVLLNTVPQCSWWRMYYESTFPSLSQCSLALRLKLRLLHGAHAMCSSWLCVEKHYKEALLDLFRHFMTKRHVQNRGEKPQLTKRHQMLKNNTRYFHSSQHEMPFVT